MPKSNYVYIQNQPIDIGAHGDDDYAFHSSEPVNNEGKSSLVFQSGQGLGKEFVLKHQYTWEDAADTTTLTDQIGTADMSVSDSPFVTGKEGSYAGEFDSDKDPQVEVGQEVIPQADGAVAYWVYHYETLESAGSTNEYHWDTAEESQSDRYLVQTNDGAESEDIDTAGLDFYAVGNKVVSVDLTHLTWKNTWRFVTCNWDSNDGVAEIWVDANLQKRERNLSFGNSSPPKLRLGRKVTQGGSNPNTLDGRIDDFRIYEEPISKTEMEDAMSAA